jgi:hypothetical protein
MDNIINIKKERFSNIVSYIDNTLSYITNNNQVKGNIILVIHYILILTIIILAILLPINRLNSVILWCIITILLSINIYYSKLGTCFWLKLERYFYDDKTWYGINTPVYKLFGINNKDCYKQMLSYTIMGWLIILLFYVYRIYLKYTNKKLVNKKIK